MPRVDAAGLDLGRFRALVIGNEAYRDVPRLATAHADAKADDAGSIANPSPVATAPGSTVTAAERRSTSSSPTTTPTCSAP